MPNGGTLASYGDCAGLPAQTALSLGQRLAHLLRHAWLVPPRRWHFGAVALEPVDAVQLDTTRLRVMAEDDPSLGYRLVLALFGTLLERLQGTRARLLDLYRSPRDR